MRHHGNVKECAETARSLVMVNRADITHKCYIYYTLMTLFQLSVGQPYFPGLIMYKHLFSQRCSSLWENAICIDNLYILTPKEQFVWYIWLFL